MDRNDNSPEDGTVLFAMALLTLVISGLAMAYYQVAGTETLLIKQDISILEALHVAEAGIDTSIDSLNQGLPGAIVAPQAFGSGTFLVQDFAGGPGRRVLRSRAVVGDIERRVEAVVEDRPGLMRVDCSGAVSAGLFAYLLGSPGLVLIDGRDHSHTGDLVLGMGRFGISTAGDVYAFGDAKVGGYGNVPIVNPDQSDGVLDYDISYGDLIDNDADGAIDEEMFNGIDDDDDGKIDEDLVGYPSDPDAYLGVPTNTLREAAIRGGTYFSSQLDYELYLTLQGGGLPGGQVIYLDFEHWYPADFGDNLNLLPSIVVHHHEENLGLTEELEGRFKGLLLSDNIWHFTGGFQLVGASHTSGYQVWGATELGDVVEILYSEDVLNRLPEPSLNGNYQVISWREISEAAALVAP